MISRMTNPMRLALGAAATFALATACRSPQPTAPAEIHERLSFRVEQGARDNHFLRDSNVAAHLVMTSGKLARMIFAFPAGNAGIGLWLGSNGDAVKLALERPMESLNENGLRGVRAIIRTNVRALEVAPVLSSIRVLRTHANGVDMNGTDPFPPATALPPQIVNTVDPGTPLVVRRTSLDGHLFELRISLRQGKVAPEGARVRLTSPQPLAIILEALTDYPPLGSLTLSQILKKPKIGDPRDREVLAFLSYREKMLAGSWRYLTYFGRDTLLTACLLFPVLRPEPIEGALAGVLDRLSPEGEVAHEEDIGEFAALRHLEERETVTGKPVLDYKMVDDDFMLVLLAARYFASPEGAARSAKFLANRTPDGRSYADALRANMRFVIDRTAPYAKSRNVTDLVALKAGVAVGDWRDSPNGLGGGRISYSVNVALVPAALAAVTALSSGALVDPTLVVQARDQAVAWRDVGRHFDVRIPEKQARSLAANYAKALNLDPKTAAVFEVPKSRGKPTDHDLSFPALSLNAEGKPIPVMHTDDSFLLYFGAPTNRELRGVAERLLRPFPAGLRTPLGIVIANGAYLADDRLRRTFGKDRYHGAVIWSWQQALMAAGLARQLRRTDLAPETRADLVAAQAALWQVITATRDASVGELWSWKLEDGKFAYASLGSHRTDDEATAAQLWSTVYLAIPAPTGGR